MMFIEFPILLIFILGFALTLIPAKDKPLINALALAGAAFCLVYGIFNFVKPITESYTGLFIFTRFSGLIALGCAFFGFIVAVFSRKFAADFENLNRYYGYIFISVSFAIFTVYAANLVALVVFWGLSGLMLYLLAALTPGASNAAKKTFIFAGGSDSVMVLGISIFAFLTGGFDIYGSSNRVMLEGNSLLATVSFLCLAIAALTKAGSMPFHSWLPDFAQEVPLNVTAFLPAAIDKLLGIFLLFIICHQLFVLNAAMTVLLLIVGSTTLIFATYLSLVQQDGKKLLAYCAVSQVGYIILGISSGTTIGIIGGMFHMMNHAIYKSCLFLSCAAVENKAGSTKLDRLGGLSRFMPITFVIALIASLSVSGIPPFNGFVSKWMVYQSLISQMINPWLSPAVRFSFIIALIVAMFGSALTLAAFVKFIHSIFLGQPSESDEALKGKVKEANISMLVPMGILASLCVLFGLFAFSLPLKQLLLPGLAVFGIYPEQFLPNLWQTSTATVLIIVSLAAGLLIYLFANINVRKDIPFTGCEELPLEGRAEGTGFYKSIADIPVFRILFAFAEKRFFDIYDLGSKAVLGLGSLLSHLHTGSMRTYILWFMVGIAAIFAILIRGF